MADGRLRISGLSSGHRDYWPNSLASPSPPSLESGAGGVLTRNTSRRSPSLPTSYDRPRSATSVASTSTYPSALRRCIGPAHTVPLKDSPQISPTHGSSSSRSPSASSPNRPFAAEPSPLYAI